MATTARASNASSASAGLDEAKRWKHVDNIRKTPGPFTDPIAGTQEAIDQFDNIKVLYAISAAWTSREITLMPYQGHVRSPVRYLVAFLLTQTIAALVA